VAVVPSKLSIIKDAAIILGEPAVVSLDEDSKVAAMAGASYDTVYGLALNMHPWTFGMDKISLSLLAGTPINQYLYAYQIPTEPEVLDILQTIPHIRDYKIYGQQLHCNIGTGVALDVKVRPSEAFLKPYFVALLAAMLAKNICIGVTGKKSLKDSIGEDIIGVPGQAGLLGIAQSLDSQQRPQVPIVHSPFTETRR